MTYGHSQHVTPFGVKGSLQRIITGIHLGLCVEAHTYGCIHISLDSSRPVFVSIKYKTPTIALVIILKNVYKKWVRVPIDHFLGIITAFLTLLML